MNGRIRLGAALALVWYLAAGFGGPLLDAVVFHDQESPRAAHVESSDSRCHRADCSLDAPGAPQSPAPAPANLPVDAAVACVTVPAPAPDVPRSRSTARAHAPRAPPQYT
jgi:hypothetical protein